MLIDEPLKKRCSGRTGIDIEEGRAAQTLMELEDHVSTTDKLKNVRFYHAHVYFDETTKTIAEKVRDKIIASFHMRLRVHPLIDVPIGPHPLPMFEVDLRSEDKEELILWLKKNHADLSVLVHPLTGDEMADHRDFPEWVGTPQPLNLAYLEGLR